MSMYIGLLRKDTASDYGVEFPDFPGCVTAGRTLEEARKMAAEALALHIDGLTEDGLSIPEPSTLDRIMSDPKNRQTVAVLIEAPMRPARSIRINVMLPEDLLRDIDRVSANRYRFLVEAARAKLHENT